MNLQTAFSHDRLQPYLNEKGNLADAIALYTMNVRLCMTLYPCLQAFEVSLRNTMHQALSAHYGTDWYINGRFRLRPQERQTINDAVSRLRRVKNIQPPNQPSPGSVVAELMFGFWKSLLNNYYDNQLWRPHSRQLFPHALAAQRNINAIRRDVADINHLRNRVFHYEPIWNDTNLVAKHLKIYELVRWVNPSVVTWLQELDEFPHIYQRLHAAPASKSPPHTPMVWIKERVAAIVGFLKVSVSRVFGR